MTLGLELGVKEITTYALSLENLNRPKDELEGLWHLMEVKFTKILDRIEEFLEKNVVIQFIGKLSLMPKNLQKLCAEIMFQMQRITEPELTCFLAICYTSRDEITTSIKTVLSKVKSGALYPSDIDAQLLQKCLYRSTYPVDMIIRTSGETRLSDFLLWQCSDAVLYFTDILWPEFSQWEMLKSIVYFQYCRIKKPVIEVRVPDLIESPKMIEKFVESEKMIQNYVELSEMRTLDEYKKYSKAN